MAQTLSPSTVWRTAGTATTLDPSPFKLLRWFRWLISYHLAIMSTPRHEEDIAALASPHLGICHVLTLTEEEPLPLAAYLAVAATVPSRAT
jgi:hypothetical protein